jgi:nucleotide-binding universal stress UspA family protein
MFEENKGEANLLPTKILLPVDGSENSLQAARVAITIAKRFDAELLIRNVVVPLLTIPPIGAGSYPADYGSYYDNAEKNGAEIVERIANLAQLTGVRFRTFVELPGDSTVDSIVRKASDEKVDLIVIGTRGLGGLHRLLGSVSSGVVTHAKCNVLVAR